MNAATHRLDLPALDGANPLGFLAALGTVAVLAESESGIKLGWQPGAHWTPFLQSFDPLDQGSVVVRLVVRLRGTPVDPLAENQREAAQKCFDRVKKRVKKAKAALKERKLRGQEREAAWKAEVEPLEQAEAAARTEFLAALKAAVPSPELALGQRPDCTIAEFRDHAGRMVIETRCPSRTALDLLTSFGTEFASNAEDRITATPFCLITGSGHQWFLDTARQLMATVSEAKVLEALFEPWAYRDEKLTMRWDPLDDRRYALMDRDPTASDNRSTTVWMANLLAYRALAFFPCAASRQGSLTAGWTNVEGAPCFTWPLWQPPLNADTIRSLLGHAAFAVTDHAPHRRELHARGVAAVFRARRIQVGNPPLHKMNFSPATAL